MSDTKYVGGLSTRAKLGLTGAVLTILTGAVIWDRFHYSRNDSEPQISGAYGARDRVPQDTATNVEPEEIVPEPTKPVDDSTLPPVQKPEPVAPKIAEPTPRQSRYLELRKRYEQQKDRAAAEFIRARYIELGAAGDAYEAGMERKIESVLNKDREAFLEKMEQGVEEANPVPKGDE